MHVKNILLFVFEIVINILVLTKCLVSERKMTKQRNREAKKLEVNLNYLRNDLDIWQHRVQSWLHAKSKPQQNEIDKFGIEVVQQLCTRKVLLNKMYIYIPSILVTIVDN